MLYEPFGEELDASTAILQAAAALDIAAFMAIESDNSERLVQVAALWIEVCERLMGPGPQETQNDDEEEEPAEVGENRPFGFAQIGDENVGVVRREESAVQA